MMGFRCLRLDGDFFASSDPHTGSLIVKLDVDRAAELIDRGQAEAFAPGGRRFREWVAVPSSRHRSWAGLLDRALQTAVDRRL